MVVVNEIESWEGVHPAKKTNWMRLLVDLVSLLVGLFITGNRPLVEDFLVLLVDLVQNYRSSLLTERADYWQIFRFKYWQIWCITDKF